MYRKSKGGGLDNVIRMQVTLSVNNAEKLQELSDLKGLSKSAIIALALDNIYREEVNRDK